MNIIHANTYTALIRAAVRIEARDTKYESVKILLSAGAHVNKVDKFDNYHDYVRKFYRDETWKYEESLQLMFAAGERMDYKVEDIFKCPDLDQGLKQLCREAIRSHLLQLDQNINLFVRIPRLGLPTLLVKYLLYNMSLDSNVDEDNK